MKNKNKTIVNPNNVCISNQWNEVPCRKCKSTVCNSIMLGELREGVKAFIQSKVVNKIMSECI